MESNYSIVKTYLRQILRILLNKKSDCRFNDPKQILVKLNRSQKKNKNKIEIRISCFSNEDSNSFSIMWQRIIIL